MQALVLHKIRPNFDEAANPLNINEFKLVADVWDIPGEFTDRQALEYVFDQTNHIDKSWTENESLCALGERQRSTSVGDVVYLFKQGHERVAYQCMNVGWAIADFTNAK